MEYLNVINESELENTSLESPQVSVATSETGGELIFGNPDSGRYISNAFVINTLNTPV
jgi:hypothetical protein